MTWRRRFEALIAELSHTPGIVVREATLGPPTTPDVLARARAVAGAAWPDGMTEFYAELGSVDLEYGIHGEQNGGAIHIPRVSDVWDHAAHEDELWFDWLVEENPDHPFTRIRPIDRFVPEAYAVLYPVPTDGSATAPATVHYHHCGEALIPTGLSYRAWLELLLRARGALYWLKLAVGKPTHTTWVEENIALIAARFPSFDPASMSPPVRRQEIRLD